MEAHPKAARGGACKSFAVKTHSTVGAKFLSHFAKALIMKAICIQLVLLRSSRKRNKKGRSSCVCRQLYLLMDGVKLTTENLEPSVKS
jgi:hypothetical protein